MRGNRLTLEIVDMALPDGYGVGKKDGFVFFVSGLVTGDTAVIQVTREGKRFSYGETVEILEPSPHRRQAECPHFGSCGGCSLQHVSYEKQLEIKANYLRQTLARIGGVDMSHPDIAPIVPSPQQFGSRNKIELAFGMDRSGITIGLRERASPGGGYEGKVIPLTRCPLFSDALAGVIPLFASYVGRSGLLPYDPAKRTGFLRHLVLRESKSTGKMMAILETKPGVLPDASGLWRDMEDKAPMVTGFYHAVSGRNADTGLYDREELLCGEEAIRESLADLTFAIYPQSFFQPNTACADLLYRAILDLADPHPADRVVGLYSGMGPIEVFLSRKVQHVTGVDSNPANTRNALLNCRENGITNCTFIQGKVEDVRARLPRKPDILVIDPPRGGITPQGLKTIAALEPRKFIYVSCNPSTFARDLTALRDHGYHPRKIVPFDAFPHTSHLETVALLERA